MRIFLFLLLLLPFVLRAQFKRSATELAKENIREYLTTKLFKNYSYQSISYGELTSLRENDPDNESYIKHKFAITEIQSQGNKKDSVQRLYDFIFYLDNRMRVFRATSLITE